MPLFAYALVALAIASCSGVTAAQPAPTGFNQPLLSFDVVGIPRAGVAGEVSGDVEILNSDNAWVRLTKGMPLLDGTKLRIGAGARLTVQFSPSEHMEFRPADEERWIVLVVVKT